MCRACKPETPSELRKARHTNTSAKVAPPELVAEVVVSGSVANRLRIEAAKPLLRMALMIEDWKYVRRALRELSESAPVDIDLREARGAD